MKKITFLLLLNIIITSFLLSGCKDKDEPVKSVAPAAQKRILSPEEKKEIDAKAFESRYKKSEPVGW